MDWKREGKQAAREYLLSNISFTRPIRYLGLPAAQAIFERQLCARWDVSEMHLFERDSEIYQNLCNNLKQGNWFSKEKVTCYNASVALLDQTEYLFDLAWYDYCGPLCPSSISTMFSAVKKMLSLPGSYVAFTYMIGREPEQINEVMHSFYEEGITDSYLKRISFIRSFLYRNFSEKLDLKFFSYRDTAPMLLVVISLSTIGKHKVQIESLHKDLGLPPNKGRPSKAVLVEGFYYPSVLEASLATGISKSKLYRLLKSTDIKYQYV